MRAEEFRAALRERGFPTIGQRLLRTRHFYGLSVRELADLAHVSKNTVTRLEKGLPVHDQTVIALARALKIRRERLVAAEFHLEESVAVARAEAGRWFDANLYRGSVSCSPELPSDSRTWSADALPFSPLASRDSQGRFNPNLMILRAATPSKSHRGEEFAYVLSGKMRLVFDDHSYELGPGDSVYFWAAESHRYEPLTEEAHILSIVIDPFPESARGLRLTRAKGRNSSVPDRN